MPHTKIHRDMQALDRIRGTIDGLPVLSSNPEVIRLAIAGDKEAVAANLLGQFLGFDNTQAEKRNEAAVVGERLGKDLTKIAKG